MDKTLKKNLSIAGLLIVTAIWGGGFVASDIALKSFTPMQIMTIRFLLATILMAIPLLVKKVRITRQEFGAGALIGLALFAGFALQVVGLQYTTPSKNAFLTAINVVIVPFIAYLITRRKIAKREVLGALLSVIGAGVLSLRGFSGIGLGDGLTLLCAFGFAFQIVLTGIYVKNHRVIALNFVQMLTSFVLSLLSVLISGQVHFSGNINGCLSVFYLGAISTALCYAIQTICQKNLDETQSAVILSMESVFGMLFSVILLGETLSLRKVLGAAILLAGVIVASIPSHSKQLAQKKHQTSQTSLATESSHDR